MKKVDVASLPGVKRGRVPAGFSPQLATLSKKAPSGSEWLHEIKLDGFRILAFVDGKRVRLVTRNGKDWTERFPAVARSVRELPIEEGVLDGEVVALDRDGKSSFQLLQNAMKRAKETEILYQVFDLPFYAGYDLRGVSLVGRKALLATLVPRRGSGAVGLSDYVGGKGPETLREACRLGLEGIVSKRADAPYDARRTRDWLKTKCSRRQELVVTGWTDPRGARSALGALLLGHRDEAGRLVYSGKVGTGFDASGLEDLERRLKRLATAQLPYDVAPPPSEVRGAHWVKPTLVVEVEFTEWTEDGRLRHPAFVGIREDKKPEEVVREEEIDPSGVRLTHPERVLWPEQGLTKAELAAYYGRVAERMLPHVAGRPLAIVRCPRGAGGSCFFQKHHTDSLPEAIGGVAVDGAGKPGKHMMISDVDGLVSLVQIGALEIHPWGARADRLDRPDRIVFDLDPGPGVAWPSVVTAAQEIRDLLQELGLQSFARISGGSGLHVLLPIDRRSTWDEVKAFSHAVAEAIASRAGETYVTTASKTLRKGKIFIDWLRNARGATAIAPYSTRARAGATVAAPVTWSELKKIQGPDAIDVRSMQKRIAGKDPWPGFFSLKQAIPRGATSASSLRTCR